MGTVNFINKASDLVMQFSLFNYTKSEVLTLVEYNIHVDFEGFKYDNTNESELIDLTGFLSSLEKLYNGDLKVISFSPLMGNISMLFETLEFDINVKIEITNNMSSCNLILNYTIDQTFLPSLIKEVEEVLEELSYLI